MGFVGNLLDHAHGLYDHTLGPVGQLWNDAGDPILRNLSLVTINHDANGNPSFTPHIPGTDGGQRQNDGTITPGRSAVEVIDPVARSLSLVTINHDPNGNPYFAGHIPFTPGGYRDPKTGIITDGENAGTTVHNVVTDTTHILTDGIIKPLADTAGDQANKLLGTLLPVLIIAGVALILIESPSPKEKKA